MTSPLPSWCTPEARDQLGQVNDAQLARRLQVSRGAVFHLRRRLGIAPAQLPGMTRGTCGKTLCNSATRECLALLETASVSQLASIMECNPATMIAWLTREQAAGRVDRRWRSQGRNYLYALVEQT